MNLSNENHCEVFQKGIEILRGINNEIIETFIILNLKTSGMKGISLSEIIMLSDD